MKLKNTLIFLSLFVLASCAGSPKMNHISIGMKKSEVIEILGEPDSTSGQSSSEFMRYNLWRGFWDRKPGDYSDPYYVRLVNGKVESYGRVGDFDSTQTPEQTINMNIKKY